jgi:hypothetical protein
MSRSVALADEGNGHGSRHDQALKSAPRGEKGVRRDLGEGLCDSRALVERARDGC